MKKLLLFLCFFSLISIVSAEVAGDYLFFNYGIDQNVGTWVADINGQLDTDFSSNCFLDGKYQATNKQVFDANQMLNDPILLGFYYLTVPFSNTTDYPRGKYDVLVRCYDGDANGLDSLSFVLDSNTSSLISDLNNTILDVNSTTLASILANVEDLNQIVSPDFLSNAFNDDLNLYKDSGLTSLAHGESFQPGTTLFFRGTVSSGSIPATTNFDSVKLVFCSSSNICFEGAQGSSPIVVGGVLSGSVLVPQTVVGDYNFFVLVAGQDNSGTNVTVNGSTPSVGIEALVAGVTVSAGADLDEWRRAIDSGEIKVTQQIIDAGLASQAQIEFFEKSQPDYLGAFLLTPRPQLNFLPLALIFGVVLLVVGGIIATSDYQVLGFGLVLVGVALCVLPFLG